MYVLCLERGPRLIVKQPLAHSYDCIKEPSFCVLSPMHSFFPVHGGGARIKSAQEDGSLHVGCMQKSGVEQHVVVAWYWPVVVTYYDLHAVNGFTDGIHCRNHIV